MRKHFSFLLIVLLQTTLFAENMNIHPKPQSVKKGGSRIVVSEVRLIGQDEADKDAVKKLQELLSVSQNKKSYPVYIGEKGDKAVKKYADLIPDIAGGYYLSANPERIIIAGNDEQGTYYALQTLSQLLQDNSLPEVEITDFPSVKYRGVVEGFYGQPWSHNDRISLLEFFGDNKLNTYIYGPKDDPYHSCPNWRKPYPAEAAQQIKELASLAKANKVDFVWAIHPGQDIQWNDADRAALLKKFESMYDLGVRSFAVFFDDISGEGTDPVRQAELLNYLHTHFVAVKKDVTPLVMCPTQYNKSWADPKPGTYLDILGEKLDPSVQIMWTGDRVVADITAEGLSYINARIKRPAYIWWNFPVSDYVRDHLLMGRVYGLDTQVEKQMSGFVSNPMERAEASKIAIYGVADYAWNTKSFDSQQEWEDAIKYIMPKTADAFRTFSAHNSDLGPNGHGYRREESVEIKKDIDRFLAEAQKQPVNPDTYQAVYNEFEKIRQAPSKIISGKENPALIAEIMPWLEQFELLGETGTETLEFQLLLNDATAQPDMLWEKYGQLLELAARKNNIDKKYNQNPYQPGVKTGSLVMQPFVDNMIRNSGNILYSKISGNDKQQNHKIQTKPQLLTNVEQIQQVPLQISEQSVAVTPILEIVKIAPQQYIGIKLPLLLEHGEILIDMDNRSLNQWGKVEISEDGNNWKQIQTETKGTQMKASFDKEKVKAIRLVNASNETKNTRPKKISATSEQLSGKAGNLLTALDNDLSTAYLLKDKQVVNNILAGRPAKVSILTTPNENSHIEIVAIDLEGKRHPFGFTKPGLSAFDLTTLNKEVRAIEISSEIPVTIHEIIWTAQ